MRVRTWSACVALAWGILLIMAAAGPIGSVRPAQATASIAGITSSTSVTSSTSTTSNTTTQATPAGRATAAQARVGSTGSGATGSGATGSVRSGATGSVRSGATGSVGGTVRVAALTGSVTIMRAGGPSTAAAPARARQAVPADADVYVVQPGDTLSGIAAALGTPGGWPALYAANRGAIGPDPDLIRAGTVLVLPGRATLGSYAVQAGDTLSGIAAAVGVTGGWPALYAANRAVIGRDPDAIRAGTVLAIPAQAPASAAPPAPPTSPVAHPTAPAPAAGHTRPSPAARPGQAPAPARVPASARPSAPATAPATATPAPATPPPGRVRHPQTTKHTAQAPIAAGLPGWLLITLAAAGLLITTAFLTEPVLALARRRRSGRPDGDNGHIVLADYERLVVTHSTDDGTVYVLRPPDADPLAILLAARLVLAQDRYEALAGHLGVPANWPRE